MPGPRVQHILDLLFPSIPTAWESDFRNYQRQLARRIGVVAAVAVLFILPAFQLIEFLLYEDHHRIGLRNALWRLPVLIPALVILVLRWRFPLGDWPRPMLLLLAFAMMFMMVGIFANEKVYDGAPVQYTAQGLIMTIGAMSVAATRGLRDIPVIYGLPLLALPLLLSHNGVDLIAAAVNLIYPAVMVVVACILAELLYNGYVQNFIAAQQLRQSALTDPLTGLLNRRAMDQELAAAHALSRRHHQRYAVIMADLDYFKQVNDSHGHDVGDEVLVELAHRLSASVRAEDRVSRWGGEEFLILLQNTDKEPAYLVAEKVRQVVGNQDFKTSAGRLSLTISLGLAINEGTEDAEAVVTRADKALYEAKRNGRNRTECG
ncbi:GGDEF domain-containing protein [Gammaproteobacteria bacterium AB-CW1]|uniref:diguanylate cyclase n=1 Tax=Natronospira elongata TaxID=3110268 RepID=A0AAP6MMF9_9GAMM|nr:GGDEF domain-containing protein [Gammaproteobacteria bacterium AB-CW1]MEA5446291.1 GGDEF domain-containing protein [Gammaproteobacteria bacterium AB-CW1]